MEGTIGEIRLFAGNFPPRSWAYCDGQLLSISANQALFSILGTTYGGDGRTTFALPDFRSRNPIGTGHGPGLTNRVLGQKFGSETNTMTTATMPSHNHTGTGKLRSSDQTANNSSPVGNFPAVSSGRGSAGAVSISSYEASTNTNMAAEGVEITLSNAGGQVPFNNIEPVLGMHYVICMFGTYPSRN